MPVRRTTARFVCLEVLVTPSPDPCHPQSYPVRSPIRPQDPARRRSSDSACGLSPTLPWLSFVFLSTVNFLLFFPSFPFSLVTSQHGSRVDKPILRPPSTLSHSHAAPSPTALLTCHHPPPATYHSSNLSDTYRLPKKKKKKSIGFPF